VRKAAFSQNRDVICITLSGNASAFMVQQEKHVVMPNMMALIFIMAASFFGRIQTVKAR